MDHSSLPWQHATPSPSSTTSSWGIPLTSRCSAARDGYVIIISYTTAFSAPPIFQTLEEPGADDTTKFDLMAPTVVKSPELGGQGKVELGIIKQFLFSSEMQVIFRLCGCGCAWMCVQQDKGVQQDKVVHVTNSADVYSLYLVLVSLEQNAFSSLDVP